MGFEAGRGPDAGVAARVMPAAARLLAERGLRAEDISASGPGGRLLKEDVLRHAHRVAVGPGATVDAELDLAGVRRLLAPAAGWPLSTRRVPCTWLAFIVKAAADAVLRVPSFRDWLAVDAALSGASVDLVVTAGPGGAPVRVAGAGRAALAAIDAQMGPASAVAGADAFRGGAASARLTAGEGAGLALDARLAPDGASVRIALSWDRRRASVTDAEALLRRIRDVADEPARLALGF
jgi:hypothetical protein